MGFGVVAEPNTPAWFELHTRNYEATVDFYRTVFKWDTHWSVYFSVEDADKTLERIEALGGAVVASAEDTPYGRLAQATDPTGALFKLVAG